MFFSVIMPLYNKAPYVRKAMESVVGQTYHDWELVVVDDGSTDGGGDIVKGFADNRIKIIRQENCGVSTARNNGVATSTAPYITFLDADDWWEPTFLEEMAGLIERHPDAGIYGTGYHIVKNGKKRVAPIGIEEHFTEGEINYCQVYAKTLCMPLTSISVCMPQRVFDEMGGFKPQLKLGEDFDLWIRIALRHKVVFLNKPLSNYNQDVDTTFRGIGRLHAPEQHFLWHMDYLHLDGDLKILMDRLIAYNLIPYYLSRQYHNDTLPLLQQIEWGNIPSNIKRIYHLPLWYSRMEYKARTLGSRIKKLLTLY